MREFSLFDTLRCIMCQVKFIFPFSLSGMLYSHHTETTMSNLFSDVPQPKMGKEIPLYFIHLRVERLLNEFLSANRQSGFIFEIQSWMEEEKYSSIVLIEVRKRHETINTHESIFNLKHLKDVMLLEKHLQDLGNTFFFDPTSPTND